MNEDRRKAEELVLQMDSDRNNGYLFQDRVTTLALVLKERDRQARLEENLACEHAIVAGMGQYIVAKECAALIAKRRAKSEEGLSGW